MTDLLDRQFLVQPDSARAPNGPDELGSPPVPRRRRPWPASARLAVAALAVSTCVGMIGWARSALSDDEQQVSKLESEIVQLKADAAARAGRIDQLTWAIDELTFERQGVVDQLTGG